MPALVSSMMKVTLAAPILVATAIIQTALGIQAPTGVITRIGDQSVVLHWDKVSDPALQGYRVYRSVTNSGGPFTLLTASPLTSQGYCDLNASSVINGQTNYYYITAVTTTAQESVPSTTVAAVPHPFATDDEFLD